MLLYRLLIESISMLEVKMTKIYKNEAEKLFAQKARERGFEVTKQGYPGFILYRGNEIYLVEIKAKSNHKLKKSQHRLMNALKRYGIKCYKWSPDKDWL